MLPAQNAGTEKHISGHLRQEVEMKQKPDSSGAQNASTLGESISNKYLE